MSLNFYVNIFTSIQTGASAHVAASNENWNNTKRKLKQISQATIETTILWIWKEIREESKTNKAYFWRMASQWASKEINEN